MAVSYVYTCVAASYFFFFFFQAEDGIRDFHVTGVQTCALPIFEALWALARFTSVGEWGQSSSSSERGISARARVARATTAARERSEERRVGKECGSGWWPQP